MAKENVTKSERVTSEVQPNKNSQKTATTNVSSYSNFRKTVMEKVPIVLNKKQ